ncbi:MAG: F0F1 ATP synthase subunit delta [Clostridia bacterium]|jgi:F0F1-type ATP synthase delta subunit|nr:F0F1 ATP synthase subunit delta [Clostridia bacterium]
MTERVSVFSAVALCDADKARIEKNFGKKHSGNVTFSYTVDASLLGGLLIIDGNDYYDCTVAGRLAKVKRTLQ